MTLQEIGTLLGLSIENTDTITAISALNDAKEGEISFLSDTKHEKELGTTKATAVILPAHLAHLLPHNVIALSCDEPYMSIAILSKFFAKPLQSSDKSPVVGRGTLVYPMAHIENGAIIGENCILMSGVYIGAEVVIGNNVTLYPNVVIYRDCIIGDNVTIHAGTVIGSDGFGYAHTKTGEHVKLYQNGNVVIEKDVEIGANTTIDRAVFGSTVIKQGAKLDNLIQIGHNCIVGEHSILVSQTGLAGSTTLGRNVVIGGQSATAGHLSIAPFTTLAARSGVTKSIIKAGIYGGFPLMEHKLWLKMQAKLAKIL
jgi:UDP-3-O-[3-hydroxymyristoyl] glucosamine N-acyltransferase